MQAQDALGYTSVFTYDANLNLVQTRDPDGREVTTTYDRDNEPTRVTYADLTHADARYDAGGRVISQTNPLGQTTLYDYDSFSRLITVTTPLTVTAVYTYDQAGNMTVLTNANGLPTTFGYDAANQLRTISYADGQTPGVSFDYNALGMRTVMTDGTGVNLYSYDSLLRLTSYTNGASASVGYGYDLAGRLTTLTYPGSHTVTRGYDDADRLTSVRDWLGAGNLSQFGYDPDGNLNSITYANGVLGTLGYDAADQLRALTYTLGSNIFLQQTYTPDPAGVLASTTERQSGVLQGTHAYSYDDRYHLTGDALSGGATTSTSTWAVDPASEITATSYTLNAGVPVTTTRSYNAGNELLSFLQAQGGTTQHSYTLTYDPPGNRRSLVDTLPGGPTTSYGYDQADRLTSWAQGTSSATYRYDGDGLRQSKTVGATTTPFIWDVGAGLPLLLGDGTAQYLYGPGGMLLEQVQGTTPYYYHLDRLGSVRALTDGSGTVQDSYTYDAYGNTTASGSVANPFGYTGQYQDSESGLYYLRARYYDPRMQQFLSRDPLLRVTGQVYNYAGGSPTNASDPSGLWVFCKTQGVTAGPANTFVGSLAACWSSTDQGLQGTAGFQGSAITLFAATITSGWIFSWDAQSLADMEGAFTNVGSSIGTPLARLSVGVDYLLGSTGDGRCIRALYVGGSFGASLGFPLEAHVGWSYTWTLHRSKMTPLVPAGTTFHGSDWRDVIPVPTPTPANVPYHYDPNNGGADPWPYP